MSDSSTTDTSPTTDTSRQDPANLPSTRAWLVEAAEALELDPAIITPVIGPILDLTKDIAHHRARPAAPLTAFLVGLATAKGDTATTAAEVTARVEELRARIAADPDPAAEE